MPHGFMEIVVQVAVPWIKIEICLPDKPEVTAMANILGIDSDAVVGKLIRIWGWADTHTLNGNASGVTNSFIDRYTHCVGFADALRKVGWLSGRDAAIEFPNFNRHNGQTAKTRALTKGRVDKARGNCNGASVTKALPETETDKKFSGTERNGTNRSVETIGMQGFGTHLASKLPPRDSGDLRFLMLVGRAVDERHIAEALVHPALIGCDAKGVRKPIGMFRAALEKNIAAAGGDLDTIIKTLQGGSDGSGE